MNEVRGDVEQAVADAQGVCVTGVLDALGIARSNWYRKPLSAEQRKRLGPAPKPIPDKVVRWVVGMARANPWYGYKRIAVMCRRAWQRVKNRQAYRVMKESGLLHKPTCCVAELYQAAKLFELLPDGPNDLWQMDVTYVHISGSGRRYAITVMDYYSRYLLAVQLTDNYRAAEAIRALSIAQAEAERLRGPLTKRPFLLTDNGPSFVARRFEEFLKDLFAHVRIRYRTLTHLGLLERFHRTLKEQELHWRTYDSPEHCRQCLAEFQDRYNRLRPHSVAGAGERRRSGHAARRVRRRRADADPEVAGVGPGREGQAG